MQRSTRSKSGSARTVGVEIESLQNRITRAELRQRQLYNTVNALAREVGVSIGGPCTRCGQCHVLIKNRRMYCPQCTNERYL